MDLKVIPRLLVLFICLVGSNCSNTKISIWKEEDMEFEKQLGILNKPSVKTIQTNEGDILDCVDMYKQPAFDHPLLKNHKFQLKPSSFPVGLRKSSSKFKSIKLRSRETCPIGTVPIKRTTKEDLIRVKSLSERRLLGNDVSGSHQIDVIMKDQGFKYFGSLARVSVYNLSIAPDQVSSTNIWIQNGPPEEINIISVGWQVSQQVNGDSLTRLFTYWTGDGNHKTGCYNTLCPGFVQVDRATAPNAPLSPASTRGGPIYTIKLIIFQDFKTKNWWFKTTDHDVVIGYFPNELFNHLTKGATNVAWGGMSYTGQNGISPPMGNGYKPNGRYEDTCFFHDVHFMNDRAGFVPKDDQTSEYVDKSDCFGLNNTKNSVGLSYRLMFGGPGGNCES